MKDFKHLNSVSFTEEGLVIKRGYQGEISYSKKTYEDFRKRIIQLMNARKEHCYGELLKHINDEALVITKEQVIWDGGHFTRCVYDYLVKWCDMAERGVDRLNQEPISEELCDCCLKQLYSEKTESTCKEDLELFNWLYDWKNIRSHNI